MSGRCASSQSFNIGRSNSRTSASSVLPPASGSCRTTTAESAASDWRLALAVPAETISGASSAGAGSATVSVSPARVRGGLGQGQGRGWRGRLRPRARRAQRRRAIVVDDAFDGGQDVVHRRLVARIPHRLAISPSSEPASPGTMTAGPPAAAPATAPPARSAGAGPRCRRRTRAGGGQLDPGGVLLCVLDGCGPIAPDTRRWSGVVSAGAAGTAPAFVSPAAARCRRAAAAASAPSGRPPPRSSASPASPASDRRPSPRPCCARGR